MFRMFRIGAVLCSLLFAVAAFADPPTLRDKLNADFAAGKLSLDDATLLRIVALTHYDLLPEEYRLPVGQCASELALELSRDFDRAHPEVQAVTRYLAVPGKVRKNLKKPAIKAAKLARKDVADSAVAAAAVTIASTTTYTTTHFEIEYDPAAVTVSYVAQISLALEQSYTTIVDTYGFPAPFGGGVIDVRIAVPTFFPNDTWGASLRLPLYASIYIHPNLAAFTTPNNDPAGVLAGRIKATSAHELFHQVQYEIASFPTMLSNLWMLEGQATAMEEEVFPFVDDYLNRLTGGSGFFNNTDRAIDQLDYASVLFHMHIIERYGAGNPIILQDILAGLPPVGGAFGAIENRLDLNEVMKSFARWNFFTGARSGVPGYADAALFPTFTQFRQPPHFMSASVPTVPETLLLISPVSSRYIQIRPDTSLTTPKKLRVTVKTGSHGDIRGWVVTRRQGGTTEIDDLGFAPGLTNEQTITITNFSASTVEEVVIILANGHPGDPNGLLASYSVELEKPLDIGFLVDTTGSMWDDIAAVNASASAILSRLQTSGNDFRMAVADYKDFPTSPYGGSGDYPYRADSPFSNNAGVIHGGLGMLSASGGGDWPESLWSGVMETINGQGIGPWRANAKKAIVIMTDAPPHDPEPFTGYSIASVTAAANAGGITFGDPTLRLRTTSQDAVVNAATANGIRVYSVIVGGDYSAAYYLQQLADGTGGKVFTAYSATDVVDALIAALDEASSGGGGEPPPPPPPGGNHVPDVTGATASPSTLWPANHKMAEVQITGVTDPDGDTVTIAITAILQDEPVNGTNQGNREPDAAGVGTSTASVRAERDGDGNGRMYRIEFTATDSRGASASGSVLVCVPHDQGMNSSCVDEGQSIDSTVP